MVSYKLYCCPYPIGVVIQMASDSNDSCKIVKRGRNTKLSCPGMSLGALWHQCLDLLPTFSILTYCTRYLSSILEPVFLLHFIEAFIYILSYSIDTESLAETHETGSAISHSKWQSLTWRLPLQMKLPISVTIPIFLYYSNNCIHGS